MLELRELGRGELGRGELGRGELDCGELDCGELGLGELEPGLGLPLGDPELAFVLEFVIRAIFETPKSSAGFGIDKQSPVSLAPVVSQTLTRFRIRAYLSKTIYVLMRS